MKFVNTSGRFHNTIHANDVHFYDEVHAVIDGEPAAAFSPELLGLLAAIGIEKGKPFAPDEHLRATLEESAAVGNATARAISFRTRDPRALIYENSVWFNPFVGGSHEFRRENGARDLDGRTMFHYGYTAVTPAMVVEIVGVGSQYAVAALDANGDYLDGSRTYSADAACGHSGEGLLVLRELRPADPIAAADARVHRSRASAARAATVQTNADGSTTIWFGPRAAGRQRIQLGTDRIRKGLVHRPAPVRAAGFTGSIRAGDRASWNRSIEPTFVDRRRAAGTRSTTGPPSRRSGATWGRTTSV
jgi:hypothetical protein